MKLVPISIREAKRYVAHHHRHLRPPQGALFAIGAEKDGELVGVAIVGRPVAQALQDGYSCEITRVATDGTRNTCSFLYSRAQRALAALGYDPARTKTYTREDESGASLRAAGFVQEALLPARSWAEANVSRERFDRSEPVARIRWGIPAPLLSPDSAVQGRRPPASSPTPTPSPSPSRPALSQPKAIVS